MRFAKIAEATGAEPSKDCLMRYLQPEQYLDSELRHDRSLEAAKEVRDRPQMHRAELLERGAVVTTDIAQKVLARQFLSPTWMLCFDTQRDRSCSTIDRESRERSHSTPRHGRLRSLR